MSVFRIHKSSNYTVMSNYHFKEKKMSLKAKGLLCLMLSLSDTWDYSIRGLCAICKEQESAIRNTLNELKQFGYLDIVKLNPNETESGRFEYVYNIYEKPNKEKQNVEKQDIENLHVENQVQLNTKELNTKELNTNNIYIAQIVNYLNDMSNSNYRSTSRKTRSLINARLNEGFKVEDFKKVIDNKCEEWRNTEFEKYLRPETLFGTKFESYLNQKNIKPKSNNKITLQADLEYEDYDEDDIIRMMTED